MKLFDYSNKAVYEGACFPDACSKNSELFILCRGNEINNLCGVFGFDESTVRDCTDLDESIRYTAFDGYDFISMIHIELSENNILLREINLYVSASYLILVMPEHNSPRLSVMEKKLLDFAKNADERTGQTGILYYLLFSNLVSDFSDTLETLEDGMQALLDEIVLSANKSDFAQINALRNTAYTAKKQLRALSYIGDHILLDENKVIRKSQAHYFRNVNTRLKKLYDFAESLNSLGAEMLYTYDSRLSMKTNDTVNKLTVLTLFFGPLTVITGIYGMNFDIMPELSWPYGYPLAIIIMAVVSFVLYIILKKKKWL